MKMLSGIMKSKRNYIELLAVVLISIIPRLFGIQRFFWKDELISLRTMDINILHNPLLFGATTNLPLFFYILKLFHFLFDSISPWLYRFIPVFFGVSTILVIYYFLKKELNRKVAWLTAIIMAVSPLQVYYSQELRPYALIQLLIVLNAIFLYSYIKIGQRKKLIFFILTTVLIVFTHFTGYYFLLSEGFILAGVLVFIIIKKT